MAFSLLGGRPPSRAQTSEPPPKLPAALALCDLTWHTATGRSPLPAVRDCIAAGNLPTESCVSATSAALDINWANPSTLDNAETQLQEMITRDHNRASVIMWSVSNETPIKPERLVFLKRLVADARLLDATRLITSAMDHFDEDSPNLRALRDPLGEFLDVLGINEYVGWYERRPQDADAMQWKSIWNKPLIVSEFGAAAQFGRHGDPNERWTEEYQAEVYRHQLAMIQRIPNFAGLTPWILMDFRAPGRTLPGVQDYHNRKGLISDRGERKQAFYVLQQFYRDLQKQQP